MGNTSLPDAERFHIIQFHESTDVNFASITPEMIKSYVDTGEPMWVLALVTCLFYKLL